jgi:hypothetical protein
MIAAHGTFLHLTLQPQVRIEHLSLDADASRRVFFCCHFAQIASARRYHPRSKSNSESALTSLWAEYPRACHRQRLTMHQVYHGLREG